jgi:hypothetical protein
MTWPRTRSFECYALKSGTFLLKGDGGFENLCSTRNHKRLNGDRVKFYDANRGRAAPTFISDCRGRLIEKTTRVDSPPAVVPIKTPSRPAPVPGGAVFLVNSFNDGTKGSGFAWYWNKGGVDGRRPDAYMNIKTDGTVAWEGQKHQGEKAPQHHRGVAFLSAAS